MLATVTAFREPWEAHMLRGRLDAEGIPAFVAHDTHIGNCWDYSVLLGGVKVQVPRDRFEEACAVERLSREGAFAAVLEREFGPLEKFACPKCGSTRSWKRRPLPRAALSIVLSLSTNTVLPPLGWLHFCEECGAIYHSQGRTARYWLTILGLVVIQAAILTVLFGTVWLSCSTHYDWVVLIVLAMLAGRVIINRVARMGPAPD